MCYQHPTPHSQHLIHHHDTTGGGVPHDNAGVVFTILAATGTFPVPLNIAIAQGLLGIYISKYALYAISGVCAYFAAKSARQQLRQGQPTTTAKAMLEVGAACVVLPR